MAGADGALHPGKPVPWSPVAVSNLSPGAMSFDMQPDGTRALIMQNLEHTAPARESVVLVFNFLEQLKKIGQ